MHLLANDCAADQRLLLLLLTFTEIIIHNIHTQTHNNTRIHSLLMSKYSVPIIIQSTVTLPHNKLGLNGFIKVLLCLFTIIGDITEPKHNRKKTKSI